MKFKIDENLPIELADLLQNEGYDASTIYSESLKGAKDPTVIAVCQQEQRVLITLDLDFADIHRYPPQLASRYTRCSKCPATPPNSQ